MDTFQKIVFFLFLAIMPITNISGGEHCNDLPPYYEMGIPHRTTREFREMVEILSLLNPRGAYSCYEESKQYYLENAEWSREEANRRLQEALYELEKMSDFDKKNLLKTLINSSIGSLLIVDPKVQFLVVCLATIADIANQTLDTHFQLIQLRKILAEASAYLEESNYFFKMALAAPFYSEWLTSCEYFGDVSPHIEDAIQNLILIDMYTSTLESKTEAKVIAYKITEIRNSMINEIEKHGSIITAYSSKVYCLYENLPEILADATPGDRSMGSEISRLLEDSVRALKKAEKFLKSAEIIK